MTVYRFFDPVLGTSTELSRALLESILGSSGGKLSQVAITTAGAGTLTAAALIAGQIARTGPTGAYTDTTDTAAAIVTALGGFSEANGLVFTTNIKNATQYEQTLAGGTGVTMPAAVVVPPFSGAQYFATVGGTSASPTVTFTHMNTSPIRVYDGVSAPSALAVTTVGAGSLTSFNSGVMARGGSQSNAAFADTTDTGPNIIANTPVLGAAVGASFEWTYVNNTNATATLTANATGVTITGQAVIPPNSWVRYLITRDASATVNFRAIEAGYFPKKGTAIANGATPVPVTDSAVTADSVIVLTLKTTGGTPHGAFVSSVTAGTGFSINSLAGDTSTYNYEIRG